MRGRRPHEVFVNECDLPLLHQVACCSHLPFFQVQRARVLLAMAEGTRVQAVAARNGCDRSTIWRICQRYARGGASQLFSEASRRGSPPRLSPLQRAQIVELACLEPIARGLHITHWASADLARQAVLDGIVSSISARQVRRILQEVDLQPHRTRYWKTPRLDEQFLSRASAVLWCYAHAQSLAQNGIWVVCVDEMPNLQALERHPIRRAVPGLIQRQEFEYIRHGTVNALMFLTAHSGRMEAMCPPVKDADHYIQALRRFRHEHRSLKRVYLIQDGDPSHTAAATADYFATQHGWWRPRFTPAHASWLNEAEMLNRAFGRRYLKRQSWPSRESLIEQIQTASPEYNRLYAHPFEWTWSDSKMRQWYAKHRT